MFSKRFGLTIASFAAVGLAGCVTTHGNLESSAERLERSAVELQSDARNDSSSGYYRDAQEFAAEARDFNRTLEDRRADREDVQDAFRDLSGRYHALRDEVERSRDREAELDFKPVTEAYLDVEREMRRVGDRDRYARDD
jgi:DnaJ-class molecular chaperone with C-terminal Zn finger domain